MKDKKSSSILIVEDDTELLRILSIILEKSGYRIITATNGKEAIEKALEEKPLMLLIDLAMPVQDGSETIYMFKQSETLKDVPTVMITAIDHDIAKKLSTWAGSDYFIKKPFSNTEIIKIVDLIAKKELVKFDGM